MGVELFLIVMNELIKQIKKARFIWIVGNGGSASCAEHFATDLVKKWYPAIALSANTSVITMIANDYGYQDIFANQLVAYANSKDLLITISCSGTSKNIVQAKKVALLGGLKVFEFETFKTSGIDDYGLLEDKHLKFAHEVAKAL